MSFPQTPLITLTTDFGHGDSYVAQMKGAILSVNPHARLIDVTHRVPPQHVLRASFLMTEIAEVYPRGTVHVCVVDPGVGSERAIVAAEINHQYFVCPDNGILTRALDRWGARTVIEVQNPEFFRDEISETFHGRDIMGPVAAHLSRGVNLCELGPPLEREPVLLPPPEPEDAGDQLSGTILWVDSFGNLVTNLSEDRFEGRDLSQVDVRLGEFELCGIQECYSSGRPGEAVALFGSSGLLEVSVNCGHAASKLQATAGDVVVVEGLQAAVCCQNGVTSGK